MTEPDRAGLSLHEDTVLFREAVAFTASETGFAARLIEKDYFCTLVLERLMRAESTLVFKGGTCLAKVHAGFCRLSEDLDFAVSVPVRATRAERRRHANAPSGASPRSLPGSLSSRTPGGSCTCGLRGAGSGCRRW